MVTEEFNRYGKRLTPREYETKTADLHSPEGIRRAEMNLKIDRMLGAEYPQAKRDLMWNAYERIEAQRRQKLQFAASLFMKGKGNSTEGLLEITISELSKEKGLSTEDIIDFMGPGNSSIVTRTRRLQP